MDGRCQYSPRWSFLPAATCPAKAFRITIRQFRPITLIAMVYKQFDNTVLLKTIQRQQGLGQSGFRQALKELRHLEFLVSSWELLSSLVQSKFCDNEIQFQKRSSDLPTAPSSESSNTTTIISPLWTGPSCRSMHYAPGKNAEKVSSKKAGDLVSKCPVRIGAQAMMPRNIWPDVGLVNGAQGAVEDIGWDPVPTLLGIPFVC